MATTSELEALERGDAFVELEDAHVARVSGGDARAWLHDLVTTDVESLRAGDARPSLLLTPTGRIRAQFEVACVVDDVFELIQREPFEAAVATTLSPYVLSSDVDLAATSLTVVAMPGVRAEDPRMPVATAVVAPSILGGGCDLLLEPPVRLRARRRVAPGRGRARRTARDGPVERLFPRPGVGREGREPRSPDSHAPADPLGARTGEG
jgi:folate-binding Fe-S cluster repair protein YgfZ